MGPLRKAGVLRVTVRDGLAIEVCQDDLRVRTIDATPSSSWMPCRSSLELPSLVGSAMVPRHPQRILLMRLTPIITR